MSALTHNGGDYVVARSHEGNYSLARFISFNGIDAAHLEFSGVGEVVFSMANIFAIKNQYFILETTLGEGTTKPETFGKTGPLEAHEHVFYRRRDTDHFELGLIKRVNSARNGAFVFYHAGSTAASTPNDCIIRIQNESVIVATAFPLFNEEADDMAYICDVEANKKCPKGNCHINGGPCWHRHEVNEL